MPPRASLLSPQGPVAQAPPSRAGPGADQKDGIPLLDLDVQADVTADVEELKGQLRLVLQALEGYDPLADPA